MKEKGLSKGEFQSVCQAIGGYDKLIDTDCKDKDLLALITYIAEEDKAEKILENQSIIKVPVVRNGKQATVRISAGDLEELEVIVIAFYKLSDFTILYRRK